MPREKLVSDHLPHRQLPWESGIYTRNVPGGAGAEMYAYYEAKTRTWYMPSIYMTIALANFTEGHKSKYQPPLRQFPHGYWFGLAHPPETRAYNFAASVTDGSAR